MYIKSTDNSESFIRKTIFGLPASYLSLTFPYITLPLYFLLSPQSFIFKSIVRICSFVTIPILFLAKPNRAPYFFFLNNLFFFPEL